MDNNDALIYQAIKTVKDANRAVAAAAQKFVQEINACQFSFSVALVAAEKQVPYKPAEVYTGSNSKAHECKCGAKLTEKTNYCKECGQRLDWSASSGKDWPPYLDLPKK